MKIYKKLLVSVFVFGFLFSFSSAVHAMTPTFYLSSSGGDSVSANIIGDANSSIVLYYYLNYGLQTRTIGTTTNFGTFTGTLSTSGLGLTPGSSVYVLVNNQQSASTTWPTSLYSNGYSGYGSLSLSQTSLSLIVGQSSTVTAYNNYNYGSLYVSSNSNPGIATAYASGSSISVYGVSYGSTNIVICQSGSINSCSTLYVTVSGPIATPVIPISNTNSSGFNISGLSLSKGNTVTISSATATGVYASDNTNPNVVSVSYSSYAPGCNGTTNYSATTGQPCYNTGQYYSSYASGCTATTNYSATTGQPCYNTGQYYSGNVSNNTSAIIKALSSGSSTLTLCQNNNTNSCTTMYITVK